MGGYPCSVSLAFGAMVFLWYAILAIRGHAHLCFGFSSHMQQFVLWTSIKSYRVAQMSTNWSGLISEGSDETVPLCSRDRALAARRGD